MARIRTLAIGTSVNNQGLRRGLRQSEQEVHGFGERFAGRFADFGRQAAAGLAVGTTALAALSVQAARTSETLDRQAQSVGLNVERYSQLQSAFRTFGIEQEDFLALLNDITDRIGDAASGSEPFREAFEALGLSWQELERQSPDRALITVLGALRDLERQTDRSFRANELFGGNAERVGRAIRAEAGEIDRLADSYAGLTDEAVAGFRGATAAVGDLGDEFQRTFSNRLGASTEVDDLTDAMIRARPVMQEVGDTLGEIAANLAGYAANLLNFISAEAEARNTGTGTRFSRRGDPEDLASRTGATTLGSVFGMAAGVEIRNAYADIIFGDPTVGARGTRRRQLFDPAEFDPVIDDIGARLDAALGTGAEGADADAANQQAQAQRDLAEATKGVLGPLDLQIAATRELAALDDQRAEDRQNLIDLIGAETEANKARRVEAEEWLATLRPALTAQEEYTAGIEKLTGLLADGLIDEDQFEQGRIDIARILNERLASELDAPDTFRGVGELAAQNLSEALADGLYSQDWEGVVKALISSLLQDFSRNFSDAAINQGRRLLSFAEGGIVPDGESIIRAHPGELILNVAMQRNVAEAFANGAGGAPSILQQFLFSDATPTTRREISRAAPTIMNAFASNYGRRAPW